MIPIYKIKKIINKLAPILQKRLKIKRKLNFHVFSNKSKKYRKLTQERGDNYGVSFISSDGDADIIIFYDTNHSEKQVIATLMHELLHVKIAKLTGYVTMHLNKAQNEEERFVRILEDLFISLYWSHKL